MTTAVEPDVYVTTAGIDELFIDRVTNDNPNGYQRELDAPRARKMAAGWDRRLVGIIEVSDRGEGSTPRYAVVDGQHRVEAARLLDEPPTLVVKVHTGLDRADEARLFDRLNRERRRPTTWDHWHARRAAGDTTIRDIEAAVAEAGLEVRNQPTDGCVCCTSSLEKIHALGGPTLITKTLDLIVGVWGASSAAVDAPIVHGLALVLHYLSEPLDPERLAEALLDVIPRQLKTQALALRDMTSGSQPILVAITIITHYNRLPGRRILVSNRTFKGPKRGIN